MRRGLGHAEVDGELDEARIAFTTAQGDIFAQATYAVGDDIHAQDRMADHSNRDSRHGAHCAKRAASPQAQYARVLDGEWLGSLDLL